MGKVHPSTTLPRPAADGTARLAKLAKLAEQAKPAFDFFKGCQNSSRPPWGVKVYRFKLPGRGGVPNKA